MTHKQYPVDAICAIPRCGGNRYMRQWCCRHYASWRRYGDPLKASPQHLYSKTSIYMCWRNVLSRCDSPSNPQFYLYGGRGITVCERWRRFENFLEDMGEAPDGLWLERKDNNKGYSPDNCVWATPKEQANNRRTTRRILFQGETYSLTELAVLAGMSANGAKWRLCKLKWTPERVVGAPKMRHIAK